MWKVLYIIILVFAIAVSCTNSSTEKQAPVVNTDEEKANIELLSQEKVNSTKAMQEQAEKYDTVIIGNQIWMSKNLDVNNFRNGDEIPYAETAEEWKKAAKTQSPAWCYYDNDEANGKKYGKLYNWYAVNDARGLAPKGWEIPSKNDWETLKKELGNIIVHANKLMNSTEGFNQSGTNTTGFNAMAAGGRFNLAEFKNKSEGTYFWSATTEANDYDGVKRAFLLMLNTELPMITAYPLKYGLSVRCIKSEGK
jgi:uncharacterized protein (TIGR02145 family)